MATGDDIPHDAIREAEDRSWTARLIDRLTAPELDDEERAELCVSIERLADPRAEGRLAAIVSDRARPSAVRDVAGIVLRGLGAVERADIRAMFRDGDEIERRHAVLAMDHGEADLLEPIARDPAHPLHDAAIEAMEFGFDSPRHQALKVAALAHADADVRQIAADVLSWDEPVAAEQALLAAARDPVEAVAATATSTLRSYKSLRCVAEIADHRRRPGEPGDAANDTFEELRALFAAALCRADEAGRAALVAWMAPVWALLGFADDEIAPESRERSVTTSPRREAVDAETLFEALSAPDGAWAPKRRLLQRADAGAVPPADRARLGALLTVHADPAVRAAGARILAEWGELDAVLGLVDDPRFSVMKAAMVELGRMKPSPVAARRARAHIHDPRVRSTHAYETLNTLIAHTPPAEAVPLLSCFAAEDDREAVRVHAVHGLSRLGATREIASLLPLLAQPPLVTWGVHVALLDACGRVGVAPRGFEALADVDDLDVREALARVPRL